MLCLKLANLPSNWAYVKVESRLLNANRCDSSNLMILCYTLKLLFIEPESYTIENF